MDWLAAATLRRLNSLADGGNLGKAPAGLLRVPSVVSRGWSVSPAVNQLTPGGNLSAISCPGLSWCVAVGSALDAEGVQRPLAERWDGATWTVLPTPRLRAVQSVLDAVSCPSPSACTAVGFEQDDAGATLPLAERWDGSRWQSQPMPSPAGANTNWLLDVTCPTTSSCAAVGVQLFAYPLAQGFIEQWNGRTWQLQSLAEPPGAQSTALNSVACSGPTACTAVGGVATASQGLPLVERWNGRSWALQTAAGSDQSEFDEVSCPGPHLCIAVGDHTRGTYYHILAERWDGTRWSRQGIPDPSDGVYYPYFTDLSCSSGSACSAIGVYTDNEDSDQIMVERWDGTTWRLLPQASSLDRAGWGISCPKAARCLAAGGLQSAIFTRNTVRLGQITAVPEAAADSTLDDVDCPTPLACLAVGDYSGLVERWNGRSWRRLPPPPNPPDVSFSELPAATCVAPSACTVLITEFLTTGGVRAAAARWNGSSWVRQPLPAPKSTDSWSLNDLTCRSRGNCLTVGPSFGSGPLIEHWNGSRWRIEQGAQFPGVANAELQAVSCASTSACTAVGSNATAAGSHPFAERWDGTRWRLQPVQTPNEFQNSSLADVSCPTPDVCVAIGSGSGPDGDVLFAERWRDGVGWRRESVPPLPPLARSQFDTWIGGVSCASPSACTAVFTSRISGTQYAPAAMRWNGKGWRLQRTAQLAGAISAEFRGVACPTPHTCMAVGDRTNVSYSTTALAERWTDGT